MLTAEPTLSWIEIRDILRDTAVVIDPANADPAGQWVGGFSQWYGFGRLDVDAAVQAADTFDLGAVNLLVRDNLGDMGATVPTGGTFWNSPDIWVRASDPSGDPDPAYGVDPVGDSAVHGADNWVRVRVKNVGTGPSSTFFVRGYLTHFAGTQFRYPADYIPSINSGDPIPSPLVQATYLLGEQEASGLAGGGVQIFNFNWPSALVPDEFVGGTRWHPCLLAEISPHTGPPPTGNLVFDYTNLAQRNITIAYSDDDTKAREATIVMGHEQDDARINRLVIHRGRLPKRTRVWVRFPDRKVEAAVLRSLRRQTGPGKPNGRGVTVDEMDGKRIFVIGPGVWHAIEVPMVSGPLTPVVLGASLPEGTPLGRYEIPIVEESREGRRLGACALQLVLR
jgi:hypothetical protein